MKAIYSDVRGDREKAEPLGPEALAAPTPVYCWRCGSTDTMPILTTQTKLAEKYRCLECGAVTRVPGRVLKMAKKLEEESGR